MISCEKARSFPDGVEIASLRLESVGHYHQSAGVHPRPVTIPPFYERVELVTGGNGAILDGGAWRPVAPGDLIWNRPGDATIGQSDFENPYRCLAVTFLGPRAEGLGLPRFSRWPDLEEVIAFTHEAVHLFRDESFDRATLRDYVLSRLLFRVRLVHREPEPELPAPLRIALKWIATHCAEPCPVGRIAQASGWSAAHLHHAFRHHLGITPHQAVIRERVRLARERLVSTSQPIKQIARECGFGDASAFTHLFKDATGSAPGAYRKRYLSLAGVA